MTKVGVALPWISGICFVLFPLIGTARIVHGTCLRMGVWPSNAMALVSKLTLLDFAFLSATRNMARYGVNLTKYTCVVMMYTYLLSFLNFLKVTIQN